jgi:hypothetical protein
MPTGPPDAEPDDDPDDDPMAPPEDDEELPEDDPEEEDPEDDPDDEPDVLPDVEPEDDPEDDLPDDDPEEDPDEEPDPLELPPKSPGWPAELPQAPTAGATNITKARAIFPMCFIDNPPCRRRNCARSRVPSREFPAPRSVPCARADQASAFAGSLHFSEQ